MASFNELTPAEDERLAILIEEASEVIKAASKILRHGYGSFNPDAPEKGDNRRQLEQEVGDLKAAIGKMVWSDDLDAGNVMRAKMARFSKVNDYTHHQKK